MTLKSDGFYEGEDFKGLALGGEPIRGSKFVECRFSDCDLKEARLDGCLFRDCVFVDCDLSLARVPGSVFKSTRFEGCKLLAVDWGAASWSDKGAISLLRSLDFENCVLNFSSFVGLQLEKMELIDCIAHEVDFSEANLKEAVLRGSDLQKALFRQTDLRGADLTGASNFAIDPAANLLSGARFSLPEALALLYAMDIVLEE